MEESTTAFYFTQRAAITHLMSSSRHSPESTVENWYKHVEEGTGRRYNKADVTGPGGAAKANPVYEWKGVTRAWRYSYVNMLKLEKEGRLLFENWDGLPEAIP